MFFHPKGDLEHLSIRSGSKGKAQKHSKPICNDYFMKIIFLKQSLKEIYISFKQGAGMPCFSSNWTSQTNRLCIATSELAGFSMHTVPPAQITSNMRMQVLGTRHGKSVNPNKVGRKGKAMGCGNKLISIKIKLYSTLVQVSGKGVCYSSEH